MSGNTVQLTPEQIDQLADAIRQQPGMGAKEEFCKHWDTAESVLKMLQPSLSGVPGVGLFAGPAISVVLAAGNAAKRAVCG